MFDRSASVYAKGDWDVSLLFFQQVAAMINISPDTNYLALASFSTDGVIHMGLDTFLTEEELVNFTQPGKRWQHKRLGGELAFGQTDYGLLTTMIDQVYGNVSYGHRADAVPLVFVVTDGSMRFQSYQTYEKNGCKTLDGTGDPKQLCGGNAMSAALEAACKKCWQTNLQANMTKIRLGMNIQEDSITVIGVGDPTAPRDPADHTVWNIFANGPENVIASPKYADLVSAYVHQEVVASLSQKICGPPVAQVHPSVASTTTTTTTTAATTSITDVPTTVAPATETHATTAPATDVPSTAAPATEAPTTAAPTTAIDGCTPLSWFAKALPRMRSVWSKNVQVVRAADHPDYTTYDCAGLCLATTNCRSFAFQADAEIIVENVCILYASTKAKSNNVSTGFNLFLRQGTCTGPTTTTTTTTATTTTLWSPEAVCAGDVLYNFELPKAGTKGQFRGGGNIAARLETSSPVECAELCRLTEECAAFSVDRSGAVAKPCVHYNSMAPTNTGQENVSFYVRGSMATNSATAVCRRFVAAPPPPPPSTSPATVNATTTPYTTPR